MRKNGTNQERMSDKARRNVRIGHAEKEPDETRKNETKRARARRNSIEGVKTIKNGAKRKPTRKSGTKRE